MLLEFESLSHKTVLEVGSGRGDTTRKLVDLLSGQSGARLIVTDISDAFFQGLQDEFRSRDVRVEFICTEAQALSGIPDYSIDYLVCNYTLCAVNSRAGSAALALHRFRQVLRRGGKLLVEEEFPLNAASTPAQEIWAEKWRILKSALILAGKFPYNEIDPETLQGLCQLAGFEDVRWTQHTETYRGLHVLDFFQQRLNRLLPQIPDENIQTGLIRMAEALREKAERIGSMEVPFYKLSARK